MKFKKYYLIVAFCFFCLTQAIGQSLSIAELRNINAMAIDEVETFLLKKGFSLSETKSDSTKTVVEFENDKYGNTVTVTRYKGILKLADINYLTDLKSEYLKAKEYLKVQKFKYLGTKTEKGNISSITSMYDKGYCSAYLTSNSALSKDGVKTLKWYEIEISEMNYAKTK